MRYFSLCMLFFVSLMAQGQSTIFPQAEINSKLQTAFATHRAAPAPPAVPLPTAPSAHYLPLLEQLTAFRTGNTAATTRNQPVQTLALDTLIVGAVPNDTLVITGNWTHTGPIWVFNDGVLIFDHATVIDTGDVFVFGNGQLLADSSSFFFPQAYFYERTMLIVQQAQVRFRNCSMNFSGMSHYLGLAGDAQLEWTNVHQNDWTTCAVVGAPVIAINGCNLTGEYILQDTLTATFTQADSVILWHHIPTAGIINYGFPAGDTVYNYTFNSSTPGVSGIAYSVTADSCHTVSWALMPVNGSDVTISNSEVRLIGCWFQQGDVATASGIINNSTYANYITPLTDRNLHLINTSVETWSMYVFDSSAVVIDSCQLGEVGTQQEALVQANNLLLDGTGGYFWSTDSSFTVATNSICYTTCRSEKQSTFVLAYSWQPFLPPSAIQQSTFISVQNTLPADPVPYNGSVVWMAAFETPDTASVNMELPLSGSVWIDQGPDGNSTQFGSYSVWYQLPSQSATWFPLVIDSAAEVRHTPLLTWNTNGRTPGTYVLKLVLKSAAGDSVEAFRVMELLNNPLGIVEPLAPIAINVWPNPSSGFFQVQNGATVPATLTLFDAAGRCVFSTPMAAGAVVPLVVAQPGMYALVIRLADGRREVRRVVVE